LKEVLETLEFPQALERVAAHAAGPLGAARVSDRRPLTDPVLIRAALAQVAELAALLITDDGIRAEPVPDIGPTRRARRRCASIRRPRSSSPSSSNPSRPTARCSTAPPAIWRARASGCAKRASC
jgi:hypothetical protein